jgi:hypothetical protein
MIMEWKVLMRKEDLAIGKEIITGQVLWPPQRVGWGYDDAPSEASFGQWNRRGKALGLLFMNN